MNVWCSDTQLTLSTCIHTKKKFWIFHFQVKLMKNIKSSLYVDIVVVPLSQTLQPTAVVVMSMSNVTLSINSSLTMTFPAVHNSSYCLLRRGVPLLLKDGPWVIKVLGSSITSLYSSGLKLHSSGGRVLQLLHVSLHLK